MVVVMDGRCSGERRRRPWMERWATAAAAAAAMARRADKGSRRMSVGDWGGLLLLMLRGACCCCWIFLGGEEACALHWALPVNKYNNRSFFRLLQKGPWTGL